VNDRGPVRDVDYDGMLDYGGRDVDSGGMKQPFCFKTLSDIVNRVSEEILEADLALCSSGN